MLYETEMENPITVSSAHHQLAGEPWNSGVLGLERIRHELSRALLEARIASADLCVDTAMLHSKASLHAGTVNPAGNAVTDIFTDVETQCAAISTLISTQYERHGTYLCPTPPASLHVAGFIGHRPVERSSYSWSSPITRGLASPSFRAPLSPSFRPVSGPAGSSESHHPNLTSNSSQADEMTVPAVLKLFPSEGFPRSPRFSRWRNIDTLDAQHATTMRDNSPSEPDLPAAETVLPPSRAHSPHSPLNAAALAQRGLLSTASRNGVERDASLRQQQVPSNASDSRSGSGVGEAASATGGQFIPNRDHVTIQLSSNEASTTNATPTASQSVVPSGNPSVMAMGADQAGVAGVAQGLSVEPALDHPKDPLSLIEQVDPLSLIEQVDPRSMPLPPTPSGPLPPGPLLQKDSHSPVAPRSSTGSPVARSVAGIPPADTRGADVGIADVGTATSTGGLATTATSASGADVPIPLPAPAVDATHIQSVPPSPSAVTLDPQPDAPPQVTPQQPMDRRQPLEEAQKGALEDAQHVTRDGGDEACDEGADQTRDQDTFDRPTSTSPSATAAAAPSAAASPSVAVSPSGMAVTTGLISEMTIADAPAISQLVPQAEAAASTAASLPPSPARAAVSAAASTPSSVQLPLSPPIATPTPLSNKPPPLDHLILTEKPVVPKDKRFLPGKPSPALPFPLLTSHSSLLRTPPPLARPLPGGTYPLTPAAAAVAAASEAMRSTQGPTPASLAQGHALRAAPSSAGHADSSLHGAASPIVHRLPIAAVMGAARAAASAAQAQALSPAGASWLSSQSTPNGCQQVACDQMMASMSGSQGRGSFVTGEFDRGAFDVGSTHSNGTAGWHSTASPYKAASTASPTVRPFPSAAGTPLRSTLGASALQSAGAYSGPPSATRDRIARAVAAAGKVR